MPKRGGFGKPVSLQNAFVLFACVQTSLFYFFVFSAQFFFFFSPLVCFKINQIAPNQPHLVRRNLFLKDEPEEVNFGAHSSVILIGCVYNSRQAAQQSCMWPSFKVGAWGGREEISLPTQEFPPASLVHHPSGSDQGCGVVDESFPFTLARGWISAPSGSTRGFVQWGHSEAPALSTPAALATRLCDLLLLLLKWPRPVLIGLC